MSDFDPKVLPDPSQRPGLPDSLREQLERLPDKYYYGPDRVLRRTPREAAEANAFWEESYNREYCNRMLDDPTWGR